MHSINLKQQISDYVLLCKPKVVLLMLITAWVGMILASPNNISWLPVILGTIGIGLSGGSAAAINQLIDRHIDAKMHRTKARPIVIGNITPKQAIYFACILSIIGLGVLIFFVNFVSAILTFLTLTAYAGFYTLILKYKTPQNIVIGGIAGATPPLLGWACISGDINPYALLLVLIIFTWTPPHFWALAIYRVEEYKKAKVPMLPVTHGIKFTKLSILLYTILLFIVATLPYIVGMSGGIYLIIATLCNIGFLYYAIKLCFTDSKLLAFKIFHFSIAYLLLIFCGLLVDHFYFYFIR